MKGGWRLIIHTPSKKALSRYYFKGLLRDDGGFCVPLKKKPYLFKCGPFGRLCRSPLGFPMHFGFHRTDRQEFEPLVVQATAGAQQSLAVKGPGLGLGEKMTKRGIGGKGRLGGAMKPWRSSGMVVFFNIFFRKKFHPENLGINDSQFDGHFFFKRVG